MTSPTPFVGNTREYARPSPSPPDQGSGQGLAESTLDAMTDEEADNQAKKLFSRYTRAAEAFHRH